MVVGDRTYDAPAEGISPTIEGNDIVFRSAFSVRDDSSLVVPYDARIPGACHLVLTATAVRYKDTELAAEYDDVEELGATKLSLLAYQQSAFEGLVLDSSSALCRMGRLGGDLAAIETRLLGTPVSVDELSRASQRVIVQALQRAQEDGLVATDAADLFAHYLALRDGWIAQCDPASPQTPLIFGGPEAEEALAALPETIAEQARDIASSHATALDELWALQERAWAIVVVGRLDPAAQPAWMGYDPDAESPQL